MNLNKKKQEQNQTRKGMEIEWPNEPVNSAELGSDRLSAVQVTKKFIFLKL